MYPTHIHSIFAKSDNDVVGDEKRLVIYASNPVEGETARQASDTAEKRLERLCKMMRNKVLVGRAVHLYVSDEYGLDESCF